MAAYERGEGTYAAVADLCALDAPTLERWVARGRATGSVAPYPRRGGWRCPIDRAVLRAVIAKAADATVAELCWAYNRRVPRAQHTTPTSFRRALRRDGFVLKQNGRGRARSIGRTSRPSARHS